MRAVTFGEKPEHFCREISPKVKSEPRTGLRSQKEISFDLRPWNEICRPSPRLKDLSIDNNFELV